MAKRDASSLEIPCDPDNPLYQQLLEEAAANGDELAPLGNMVLNIQMMPKAPKDTPPER